MFTALFAGALLALATLLPAYAAEPAYPVAELDGCRNQEECRLYCEIPAYKAACWSYQKHTLEEGEVLGETTAADETAGQPQITFPIEELNNCSDVQACKAHCDLPENRDACHAFAQEKGLRKAVVARATRARLLAQAKEELGCQSVIHCRQLCNQPENQDRCAALTENEILNQASSVLGCTTLSDCRQFCNNPEHQDACHAFWQNHVPSAIKQRIERRRQATLERFSHLPCDSFESCRQLCADPVNTTRCRIETDERGVHRLDIRPDGFTCNTTEECRRYCLENPDSCPGFKESQDFQHFRQETDIRLERTQQQEEID